MEDAHICGKNHEGHSGIDRKWWTSTGCPVCAVDCCVSLHVASVRVGVCVCVEGLQSL